MYCLIKINIYAKKHIYIVSGSVVIYSHLKIISRPAHRKLLESVQEIIKTTIFLNWSHSYFKLLFFFYIYTICYLIYCIPFYIICCFDMCCSCVELICVVYISFKINGRCSFKLCSKVSFKVFNFSILRTYVGCVGVEVSLHQFCFKI